LREKRHSNKVYPANSQGILAWNGNRNCYQDFRFNLEINFNGDPLEMINKMSFQCF
jgi:hypothetical protein